MPRCRRQIRGLVYIMNHRHNVLLPNNLLETRQISFRMAAMLSFSPSYSDLAMPTFLQYSSSSFPFLESHLHGAPILIVVMKIYTLIYYFKIKTGKRTRGHDFTLVKGQSRLDARKYSFSQRTVNEWNKLSAHCVYSRIKICLRTE